MHPEVTILLEIQEIDRELAQFREELGRYPSIWEKTKTRVADGRRRVQELTAAIEQHKAMRLQLERALTETSELLRRYQLQQPLVKTQKEYFALTQQIEATRERLSNIEQDGNEELRREPELNEDLAAAQAEVKAAEEFAKAEKERIRVQLAEKRDAVARLEAARAKVAEKLTPARLGQYERIQKRHPGNPVVSVRGGGCTGCNFQLLSKASVELHRGQKVVFCDNCGRVLSHDENYQPEAQSATG